eukprot:scaffold482_cov247-Pinguiococcus_pyrenoidosus.AAC.5
MHRLSREGQKEKSEARERPPSRPDAPDEHLGCSEVPAKIVGIVEGSAKGRHAPGPDVDFQDRVDVVGQPVHVSVLAEDSPVPLPVAGREVPKKGNLARNERLHGQEHARVRQLSALLALFPSCPICPHLVGAGINFDDTLGILGDAVDATIAAEQATVPPDRHTNCRSGEPVAVGRLAGSSVLLLLAGPRPAKARDFPGAGVDLQHRSMKSGRRVSAG